MEAAKLSRFPVPTSKPAKKYLVYKSRVLSYNLAFFSLTGKSGSEKRKLSTSWRTPDPKQAKVTLVDKAGYYNLIILSSNI